MRVLIVSTYDIQGGAAIARDLLRAEQRIADAAWWCAPNRATIPGCAGGATEKRTALLPGARHYLHAQPLLKEVPVRRVNRQYMELPTDLEFQAADVIHRTG